MSNLGHERRIPAEYSLTKRLHTKQPLSPLEAKQYQLIRLSTFAFPGNQQFDSIKLAEQGFYLDQDQGGVYCAWCNERLRRYRTDEGYCEVEPRDVHSADYPDCPVGRGDIADNKPMVLIEDETDSPPITSKRSVNVRATSEVEAKQSIEESSPHSSLENSLQSNTGGGILENSTGVHTRSVGNLGSGSGDKLLSQRRSVSTKSLASSGTYVNPPLENNSHVTQRVIESNDYIPQGPNFSDEGVHLRFAVDPNLHADSVRRNVTHAETSGQSAQITNLATLSNRLNQNTQITRSRSTNEMSYPRQTTGFNSVPLHSSASSDPDPRLHNSLPTANAENQRFYQEFNRLTSFRGKWSDYTQIVKEAELATNGFYYRGPGDRVQCVFCQGILSQWREGDSVAGEHSKHFPNCDFVKGIRQKNVPLRPNTARLLPQARGNAIGTPTPNVQMTRRPLTTTPGTVAGAMHPEYVKEAKRLKSFNSSTGWPSEGAVNPENLAAAGFYYTGQSDNVRCHFCDGGLRNWEAEDDPFVEHARWFPKCAYLKSVRDDDFIQSVMVKYPVKKQEELVAPKEQLPEIPSGLNLNRAHYHEALGMGFTPEQVQRALHNLEGSTIDMQSLTEALLELVPSTENNTSSNAAAAQGGATGADKNSPTEPGDKPSASKNKKKKKKKAKNNSTENLTPLSDPTSLPPPPSVEDQQSHSLTEENRQLKEQRMCKVCMDEDVSIVFLPCGHLVCCANCAPAMRACPICRAMVRGTIRTYLS